MNLVGGQDTLRRDETNQIVDYTRKNEKNEGEEVRESQGEKRKKEYETLKE